MLYKVLRNTMINGAIANEGSFVQIDDSEYAESLLADGNICQDDGQSIPVEQPVVVTEPSVAGTEATASPIPLEPSLPTQPSEPSLSEVANAAELENIPPSSDSTPPLATDIVLQ